jgi:hypothetical protein
MSTKGLSRKRMPTKRCLSRKRKPMKCLGRKKKPVSHPHPHLPLLLRCPPSGINLRVRLEQI